MANCAADPSNLLVAPYHLLTTVPQLVYNVVKRIITTEAQVLIQTKR